MFLFQSDLSAPAELLARDEALLDHCESADLPGFISFWQSDRYFVVLGYGKRVDDEVFRDNCTSLQIPIYRRCSGGGTVLQGPGCLNYSLILPIRSAPELESITGANCYIMRRNRAALVSLLPGIVAVEGHTDLTLDGLKFSGNAQRRKRRSLLFHGSFLVGMDFALMERTLRPPKQQPAYRQNRPHDRFLTNLTIDRHQIEASLIAAWQVVRPAPSALRTEVEAALRQLVRLKYSRDDWSIRP